MGFHPATLALRAHHTNYIPLLKLLSEDHSITFLLQELTYAFRV